MDIKCFLIEKTGEYTPFKDGISRPVYRRVDTGETGTSHYFGTGAIIDITDQGFQTGPDGKSYVCVCPGNNWWHIDSQASNCTKPDDKEHRCWCRHGEAPDFTVDKVGNTCSAGAGSIAIGSYHGFLRNGYLTDC